MEWNKLDNIFNENNDNTLADIAAKHGKPIHKIQAQYKIGFPIERQNIEDKDKASETTRNNLLKDPDYYTKLNNKE